MNIRRILKFIVIIFLISAALIFIAGTLLNGVFLISMISAYSVFEEAQAASYFIMGMTLTLIASILADIRLIEYCIAGINKLRGFPPQPKKKRRITNWLVIIALFVIGFCLLSYSITLLTVYGISEAASAAQEFFSTEGISY